uniref:Uncharacterized protein n=1 Tax=Arundo donax TaxID=35708 RepID=A0A0A9GJ07_ARUDO
MKEEIKGIVQKLRLMR